jgi:predicted nucleic acid-binding protein
VKTAVDTSVLLDVFQPHPRFGPNSREALRRAYAKGSLVACEIVWAEVRAHFPGEHVFEEALHALGVRLDGTSARSTAAAGRLWQQSRKARRGPRDRVVADFLIGAHAQFQADALLTRDIGFYRRYFQGLRILDPAADQAI